MPTAIVSATKRCASCGDEKALEDFNRKAASSDGRNSYCRPCAKERGHGWYRDNRDTKLAREKVRRDSDPEAWAEKNRRWEEANPEMRNAQAARARQRHPKKRAARVAVMHALNRGDLVRPDSCSRCDDSDKPARDGRSSIEAHHKDYDKPLEVEWLCHDCHRIVEGRVA